MALNRCSASNHCSLSLAKGTSPVYTQSMDIFTENFWPDIVNRLNPPLAEIKGELFFISPYLTGDRLSPLPPRRTRHQKCNCGYVTQSANVASGSIRFNRAFKHLLSICSLLPFLIYTQKLLWTRKPHLLGVRTLLAKGKIGTTNRLSSKMMRQYNSALKYARDLLLKGRRVTSEMLDPRCENGCRIRDT